MAATLLPDDVVREILACVSTDPAALFRCAITCKPWRALVADRSFLRGRCWPENARHPSSLLGFFNIQCHLPFFSPVSPGSMLGENIRRLTSIISDESYPYHDVLDQAVPHSSRDGLLLLRLHSRWIDLAVCNILTGTCDVLPPLKRGGTCWNFVILTGEDCPSLNAREGPASLPSYPVFFKVLAIDGGYNLYTFSSAQPNWSEPRKIFDEVWQQGKLDLRILFRTITVVECRGMAHWLVTYYTDTWEIPHYYTLGVDVKTCHVSLTEISIPENQLPIKTYAGLMLTATVDGRLSLLHLHEEGLRLNTWIKGDDGTWLCTRVVKLKPPKEAVSYLSCLCTWLGQKSGTLFMTDMKGVVYKIDTETGETQDVTTKMFVGMMAVPMEIDWPALFISRLSVNSYSQS